MRSSAPQARTIGQADTIKKLLVGTWTSVEESSDAMSTLYAFDAAGKVPWHGFRIPADPEAFLVADCTDGSATYTLEFGADRPLLNIDTRNRSPRGLRPIGKTGGLVGGWLLDANTNLSSYSIQSIDQTQMVLEETNHVATNTLTWRFRRLSDDPLYVSKRASE